MSLLLSKGVNTPRCERLRIGTWGGGKEKRNTSREKRINTKLVRCRTANRDGGLLLKEIFEGLAGVERAGRREFRSGSGLRRLLVRSGGGVLFDGHAKFVKLAAVFAVFGRDPLGHRLHAFKLGAGIEIAALFAAVQFGIALGAGAAGIEARSENRAAVGAARARDRADHARSARAQMIILPARTAGGRPLLGTGFSVFFFGIAVTAMAVLTIHNASVQGKTRGACLSGS